MNDTQLAVQQPQLISTLDDMERVSKSIAVSGLFGITKPEQAITLMLICQAEGLNPVAALRRYHLIEGKPAMRADAMQGEFEAKGGAFIFHIRTDSIVAATAFVDKKSIDDNARARAAQRFELLCKLDAESSASKQASIMVDISKLSHEGEDTLVRSLADAVQKGIATSSKMNADGTPVLKANWATSPRQMLTARVVTELIRLLNPGLIAGIYSEDETRDIAEQERRARELMLASPSMADREDMLKMIAEYDEQLVDAKGGHRQSILGARAELKAKLADLGVKTPEPPAEPSPTVCGKPAQMVQPVELPKTPEPEPEKKPAPTRTRKADPTPAPQEEPQPEKPWQEVVCHVGPNPGQMFDKTLATIFSRPKSETQADTLVKWFQGQLGGSTIPKDVALWKAVEAARAEWTAPASATATPSNATPAPAAQEPHKEAATPTNWREFVIEVKAPEWTGKKLGEIDLKKFEAEYLSRVDATKLTLHQKKLKALVAQAMAETTPRTEDLPHAAKVEPSTEAVTHTDMLLAKIQESGLMRADFLKVCRDSGYISATATRIEDITVDEFDALASEWDSVAKQVREEMP